MTSTLVRRGANKRRIAVHLLGLCLLAPLAACGREQRETTDVVGGRHVQNERDLSRIMYSYLDRPIHDIIFDGTDIGVANSYGGTGVITGVKIRFGLQTFTWTLGGPEGMPRNGESKKIRNKLTIGPTQITSATRYIGVHLYPDDTAEVTFSEQIPDRTKRGEKILAARK